MGLPARGLRGALVLLVAGVSAGLTLLSCREGSALGSPVTFPPGAVRPAVHAGSWYPGSPSALKAELERLLAAVPGGGLAGPVVAGIAPHAGLRYSGQVAASLYAALRHQEVERVFLLGPSHHQAFDGIALPAPQIEAFATPVGDLALDRVTLGRLRGRPRFDGPASAHEQEHSLEMQALFVAEVAPKAKLVPLLVGRAGTPEEVRALAAELRPLVGPHDVIIASSDFTHYGDSYGYTPFRVAEAPARLSAYADEATAALGRGDALAFREHLRTTGDTICGREPILVLLALLPDGARGQRLALDTSGRMTGSYEASVTYAALAFGPGASTPAAAVRPAAEEAARAPVVLDRAQQSFALRLARRTLEVVLAGGRRPDDKALGVPDDPVWRKPYGTFVTLQRGRQLRGCIGHITAVEPLWQDLRDNAISAALEDPRFDAVRLEELAGLHLEVSILTPMTPIAGPEGFVVGRHGIVLTVAGRRAVFLPQVAPEQGWDRSTTLRELSQKAGLSPEAWRSPDARFEVFEAQVFGE